MITDSTSSSSLQYDYEAHKRAAIEKIQNLASAGKSMGCFICRQINQTLPNEKDRIWVSLDNAPFTGIPQEGRLHLKFNVTDQAQMKTIQGLFDTVVLDWSSLLCCKSPYRDLGRLLKDHQASELIVEALPGSCGLVFNEASSINVENGCYVINVNDHSDYSETGRPSNQVWREDLLPTLRSHLETLFEKVIYHEKGTWPYDSGYVNGKDADFFTLRGPKVETLNQI